MDRRKFIALLSSSIPLSMAGCMSGDDGGDSGSTEPPATDVPATDEPTETAPEPTTTTTTTTPEDDGPLSVGESVELPDGGTISVARMDSSAFVLTQGDGGADVQAENGAYYVRVTFNAQGISDYESFVSENVGLTINDAKYGDPVITYASGFSTFTAAYLVPNDVTPYTGRVSLETGDVSAAWEFDAGVIEVITQNVTYTVPSVSVPESVAAGNSFDVEFTVENGGSPMTFLAQVFGTKKAPLRLRKDVPGQDAKTFTVSAQAPSADGADEFDVTLDWGADATTKTIAFE